MKLFKKKEIKLGSENKDENIPSLTSVIDVKVGFNRKDYKRESINNILGREIILEDYEEVLSKFSSKEGEAVMAGVGYFHYVNENNKSQFYTNSVVLKEILSKAKEKFPLRTTINRNGNNYVFA